jgi:hypothetical protein
MGLSHARSGSRDIQGHAVPTLQGMSEFLEIDILDNPFLFEKVTSLLEKIIHSQVNVPMHICIDPS